MCPWGKMTVGRKVLTPFSRPFRLILDSPDFSAKYTNWYVLRFFGMYPAMGIALYRQGVMDNLAR